MIIKFGTVKSINKFLKNEPLPMTRIFNHKFILIEFAAPNNILKYTFLTFLLLNSKVKRLQKTFFHLFCLG